MRRSAAARLRAEMVRELRKFVGDHDRRIADLDLGMPDLPAGLGVTHQLRRSKRFLVKLDGARRVFDDQVRGRSMESVRDGFHFACHRVCLPPTESPLWKPVFKLMRS